MSTQSVSAYLAVMLISMFLLSLYLVVHFAESQFPWHTYVTLTLGYYATFSILLLVPIDIASAVIERRTSSLQTDNAYDENFNVISVAYNTFFVAILILGSFILVFEEYYNSDGKFKCFVLYIPALQQ